MKNEEYKKELVKSIEQGQFTNDLEVACSEMISKLFLKYPYKLQKWYKPEHDSIFKDSALEVCKRLALKFNPERSDNAFGYTVQIIKSDFAKTTLKLIKEFQNERSRSK
jgi:hypothetical protein